MISIFGIRFGFMASQKCYLHKTLRRNYVTYIQGQSPQPCVREYFYYIDHQGMVFFVLLYVSCEDIELHFKLTIIYNYISG